MGTKPRIENIGFKLSFVSIFHFAVPRARFLFSASLSPFSNIFVFPFAGYAYKSDDLRETVELEIT